MAENDTPHDSRDLVDDLLSPMPDFSGEGTDEELEAAFEQFRNLVMTAALNPGNTLGRLASIRATAVAAYLRAQLDARGEEWRE